MSRHIVELQTNTQLVLEAEIVVIPPDQIVYLDTLKADTLAARDAANHSEQAAKDSETAANASQDAANVSQAAALASEQASQASESATAASATAAKASESAAQASEDAASAAKTAAISARNESYQARDAANASEIASSSSQAASLASQNAAKNSETAAKTSQEAANASEIASDSSQTAAKNSEIAAEGSAREAEHAAQDNTLFIEQSWPYSGVIGSVDKEAVFWHAQTETFTNKIRIRTSAWNIYGRFVSLINYDVALAEAESTAERAIAFDDIFLDWNGNTSSYRSITPHRTTTGYDADAIATEHGYTKVQTGLYQTGDSYALLLCRVARRNKGAYHPLWNPEGSSRVNAASLNFATGTNWYFTTLPITSKEIAFNPVDATNDDSTAGYAIGTGRIGAHIGNQPEGKFYDAIYADDVTPLYYSAQNITDRQALLFDSFNRAVAGETFMGAEGAGLGYTYIAQTVNADGQGVHFAYGSANGIYSSGVTITTPVTVHNITQGTTLPNVNQRIYFSSTRAFVDGFTVGDIVVGDVCVLNVGAPAARLGLNTTQLDSARPQFLACDIIGALDSMPQEWLDNGLPGNWLAVGEEEEDLIPDGTSKNFKLSRKCLECNLVLQTYDNGTTWSDVTSSWESDFESASNARTTTVGSERCIMVFYRTAANPFELAANAELIADDKEVRAVQNFYPWESALICSNLIGKIPTASSGRRVDHLGIISRPISQHIYSLNNHPSAYSPFEHQPADLARLSGNKSACKFYGSLTNEGCLQILYKEFKHNDSSWGDDNKFNIIDNQTTVTDLNGETVIVGQKRCTLPYHFDGVTY